MPPMRFHTEHIHKLNIYIQLPPNGINTTFYKKGCTRLATASDKVYQLLAHGWWFSLGTPASSTTETGHHDIAEILLKVALNTINQIKSNPTVTRSIIMNMHLDPVSS
jgi:hypothetical protein